jgi:hypothetical protein
VLLFAALVAALGVNAAMAQEATPDTWQKVAGTKSRAEVKQEATVARATGDLDIAREYDVVDRNFAASRSRAEVLAELEIYRRSGLAELERGEATDTFSRQHRIASARYAAMRSSPEFASLVQAIAQRRSEAVVVATEATAR